MLSGTYRIAWLNKEDFILLETYAMPYAEYWLIELTTKTAKYKGLP